MAGTEQAQTENKSLQDPLNYPVRLNDKLALVAGSAGIGDFAPTAQAVVVKKQLDAQIDGELAKLKEIWEKDLPALNEMVKKNDVPAVSNEVKDEDAPAPAGGRRGEIGRAHV